MPDEKPINQEAAVQLVGWRDRRGRFQAESDAARKVVAAVAKDAEGELKRVAKDLSPVGKHPFGVKSGYVHFADAWTASHSDTPNGGELRFWNQSEHVGFVLFPTDPHEISGHPLRWMGRDNQVHFATHVMHPGTKGNPVLQKVMDQAGDKLTSELQKATAKVVSDIRQIFA